MKIIKLLLLLLISVTFFNPLQAQVPAYVPSNGLQAWWSFNGNADDESGNGFDGIVHGATITGDRFGNPAGAYAFDSIDDHITTDYIFPTGTAAKSFSCWVKFNDLTDRGWIISNGIPCTTIVSNAFGLFTPGPAPAVMFHGNTVNGDVTFTSAFNTTDFFHFAVTFDGTTVKCYVNGLLDISMNRSLNTKNSKVLFGARTSPSLSSCPDEMFYGTIDDIGMWNRVLTPSEVMMLYSANTAVSPDLSRLNYKVYPNPANEQATIVSELQEVEIYSVVDYTGRVVLSGEFSGQISINLEALSQGIYFLQTSRSAGCIKLVKD